MKKSTRSKTSKKEAKMTTKSRRLFEEYYFEFRKSIYWYVYRKINKQELAEDITADVFVKLMEHPDILIERDENGVKAWLYTVARNQMIDTFRKASNGQNDVDVDEDVFQLIAKEDSDYLGDAVKDEQCQLVMAVAESLDEEERELITLRFKDEMKFNEIAEILGKQEGAVKMMLYRALDKIKNQLGDRLDPELFS